MEDREQAAGEEQDLWVRLDAACGRQTKVSWTWVRGHNGHPENERVDAEAQRQARLHRSGR